ncbi:MAG: YlcI/YnfO family protein [Thermomonas sp.]
MKTATLPSLRVEPALRDAAEAVLKEGETLSAFVEASVREQVELRKQRQAFLARGLASLEKARQTGIYYDADEVLAELRGMLDEAKTKAKVRKRA